ncbi:MULTISPECIES: GyrI-like domain-containing protein [Paenibacillus]|uniref:Transcriptional regulator YdeE n=1 Tax=Paenibacillus pabuli TaxID=1472 RepID=A0A855XYH5_9BACL|nr:MULTISPECIES: effector binding domain-containing protein [Paenibacillus]PWW43363.1 putative transcriptional regulator YdeE [Paenibacillus pabuli]PXW09270.1 putative transcriptional regulator YdeE [Paenibacillus taichungensis]RAJ03078.1 putative transcriptional regulator YdeE [Paenibacillus pabuli]
MEQKNEAVLITKESFKAVGLKWAGTFAEAGAGGIRAVQTEIQNRVVEIKHVIDLEKLLGLSYHINGEEGFTHYAVVEVDRVEDIPDGMMSITLPTLTYAKYEHKKGQNIDTSYNNINTWIENQGYKLHKGDVTHFEVYPMHHDPYSKDPEFVAMIPIET